MFEGLQIGYVVAMGQLTSLLRVVGALVCVAGLFVVMMLLLVVLLPWRNARIRVTNAFGTVIGRMVMWWSGCEVTVEGREHVIAGRPAIYAANHTSILDAFTTIWLTPSGTVGVAKKEVFYYPLYGQAWWLAGHLFVDRARTARAKEGLRKTGELIRKYALSLCILPEGTRSTTGRLLPFKKGIVHIALQTKLPIVPMVTTGLQDAWQKSTLRLVPSKVRIVFLPAMDTAGWTEARIDEHLEELRQAFVGALPPEMHPAA